MVMRRLIVAGLVLTALASGSALVITATQAQQQQGPIKIVVGDNGVINVEGRKIRPKTDPAPTVSYAKPPLSIIVYFNNPPGCVFIPSTGDWYC
jgi:hypothetical protein